MVTHFIVTSKWPIVYCIREYNNICLTLSDIINISQLACEDIYIYLCGCLPNIEMSILISFDYKLRSRDYNNYIYNGNNIYKYFYLKKKVIILSFQDLHIQYIHTSSLKETIYGL